MKVKCLKFNTYNDDSEYIERCINLNTEGKEIIDIKISSAHYENEDEMFLFVVILYK
jgi:hypothetical protein